MANIKQSCREYDNYYNPHHVPIQSVETPEIVGFIHRHFKSIPAPLSTRQLAVGSVSVEPQGSLVIRQLQCCSFCSPSACRSSASIYSSDAAVRSWGALSASRGIWRRSTRWSDNVTQFAGISEHLSTEALGSSVRSTETRRHRETARACCAWLKAIFACC